MRKPSKLKVGLIFAPFILSLTINSQNAHALFGLGDIVFDPENFIKNAATLVEMLEQTGIQSEQLITIIDTLSTTIDILEVNEDIEHSVTADWAIAGNSIRIFRKHMRVIIDEIAPGALGDLIYELAEGYLLEAILGIEVRYPLLERYALDPLYPGSELETYLLDYQTLNNAQQGMAEVSDKMVPEILSHVSLLEERLPQPHINGGIAILNQTVIELVKLTAQNHRAEYTRMSSEAHQSRALLRERQRVMYFLGADKYLASE